MRADQSRPKRREQLYERESRGLQAASIPARTPCCLRTTRWRISGSPIRTTPSSTMWPPGSDENGFWLSLPEHPVGKFLGTDVAQNIWPRRTKFREFRNNTAHSNFDGFMFDRNINVENVFGLAGPSYMPKENPADPDSKSLERSSRISPATRPAMAASGAAVRCMSSGI